MMIVPGRFVQKTFNVTGLTVGVAVGCVLVGVRALVGVSGTGVGCGVGTLCLTWPRFVLTLEGVPSPQGGASGLEGSGAVGSGVGGAFAVGVGSSVGPCDAAATGPPELGPGVCVIWPPAV